MSAAYCAPASRVLTVVHVKDLEVPAAEKPEPTDGTTCCGQVMLLADLWVPVELREGDEICRACQGLSDEQGVLL